MTLLDFLHEEYEVDGDLVLFRCTDCGQTDLSLGSLHAHIERHRGYTRFNIQLPLTPTTPGRSSALNDRVEVLRVTETETIPLSEVDDL